MPGVTREQIDRAKEWDLLSYLQTYEPGELTKKRPTDKEYRTKTHGKICVWRSLRGRPQKGGPFPMGRKELTNALCTCSQRP